MVDNAARERRMQRLKEEQRKEMPMKVAKGGGLIVLAVLLVGGLGAAIYFSSSPGDKDCPGHWHATVGLYVNGERAGIPQPPYNFEQDSQRGRMPLSLHMHAPNQEQIHFEPSRRTCVGLQDTLDDLGVELRSDRVSFVGAHEDLPHGGTWTDNETHDLRLFFQIPDEPEMREESFSAMRDYQLQDGEKFMLAYGDYTDEELQSMMERISWPSGARPPTHPDA